MPGPHLVRRLLPVPSRLASPRSAIRVAAAAIAASGIAGAQSLTWTPDAAQARWYAEAQAPASWSTAQRMAQAFGGHLATIGSLGEMDFLGATFFVAPQPFRHHWIGAFQDLQSPSYSEPAGGWGWVTGEAFVPANWEPGQPDDALGGQHFGRTMGQDGIDPSRWADDTDSALGDTQDLYVPSGVMVLDTTSSFVPVSQVTFVPGTDDVQQAVPLGSIPMVGGVLSVGDVVIEPGARIEIVGPNPFTLLASGRVVIRGQLVADGLSSPGVVTLNTTNIPEPGAPGRAGGGRGGVGSPNTNSSSPKGGDGAGAFDAPGLGGQGGESGWSSIVGTVNVRRGAGGGGGVLGRNQAFPNGSLLEQRRIGLDAEKGFDNLLGHNGALSGPVGPLGGAAGPGPFRDSNPANDHYGLRRDTTTGVATLGELARPWAGAGGGGGGDASRVPNGTNWPGPWNPTGDEKGSGGAGGGGSVHVIALEHIVFGPAGQIRARGGVGGGGENTNFVDRVGGGSGGGSGGHVVLESATRIDFSQKSAVNWDVLTQNHWAIDVRGGQGGAGTNDSGGGQQSPTGQKETVPTQDACPPGYPTFGINACMGHVDGAGGDGGPGIIQLHTPHGLWGTSFVPTADLVLPTGGTPDRICAPAPLAADNTPTNPTSSLVAGVGQGIAVFELVSPDCDADLVPDRFEIAMQPALDADGDGTLDACQPAIAYCQTSTTSIGCSPAIAYVGTPSASAPSGFDIVIASVEGQRAGTIFYGFAPKAGVWDSNNSSTLCVASPVQRTGLLASTGIAGLCTGQFRLDWNAWRASHPGALGSPHSAGQTLFAQGWFRDTGVPRGNLSNGLQFTLAP
jgi:hypothetical protein